MRIVGEDKTMFLPGTTTAGHYQSERACQVCHTPFVGVAQEACLSCQGAELKAVNDSHPKSKFTDPRNADRVALLDARQCVTCHQEHKPAKTRTMGVTLATDYCFYCHVEIAKERPSHANLDFATCASAGCHNFHDNTALYEDFLLKHRHEPPLLPTRAVPIRQRGAGVWISILGCDRYGDRPFRKTLVVTVAHCSAARILAITTSRTSGAGSWIRLT